MICLEDHWQSLGQKVKSYIKDNHYLSKTKSLGKIPHKVILYTFDVGLSRNIPYNKRLPSIQRFLISKGYRKLSSDPLTELGEMILKNYILKFDEKYI